MADITIKDLEPYNIGILAYLVEVLIFDDDNTRQKQLWSMNNHHIEALRTLLISFCIALKCDDVSDLVDNKKELLDLLEDCFSKIDKMFG